MTPENQTDKLEQYKGKGPMVVTDDGKVTDAGLHDNVFNGEDDAYDNYLKAIKIKKALKKALQERNIIKESLEETLKESLLK